MQTTNRFRAELSPDSVRIVRVHGDGAAGPYSIVTFRTAEARDAFVAQVNAAPAATSEELPAQLRKKIEAQIGVWEEGADQLHRDTYNHGMVLGKIHAAEMILGWLDEAAPPPEPETELVPWYEAKGRTLNGDVVIEVKQTNVHPNGAVWTRSEGWLLADADGMVSVLKETGR